MQETAAAQAFLLCFRQIVVKINLRAIVSSGLVLDVPRRAPNKVKLNDLTLKNLKPRDARAYLVWDTETRGLVVQVQPSGHLSFKYIYSRRGRPRWYSIGRIDMGLAEARKRARQEYGLGHGQAPVK
jgi:hypothetical protein